MDYLFVVISGLEGESGVAPIVIIDEPLLWPVLLQTFLHFKILESLYFLIKCEERGQLE